jgi:valyl-tRNA synthetase
VHGHGRLHPAAVRLCTVMWAIRMLAAECHRVWSLVTTGTALIVAPWPSESAPVDAEALEQFEVLQSVVRGVRNARAEYGVTPGKRVAATVVVPGDTALRYSSNPCRAVPRRAAMQPTAGNAWSCRVAS